MKKLFIILAVIVVIGLLIFINVRRGKAAVAVQTAKVFRGDITQLVTANGKIYPVKEVKISARVAGKIIGIYADEGDSVKAGQVLVRLEQDQYVASLEKAKSALLEAQANLVLRENDFHRTEKLYKKGLTSKADLDAAQARYQQALSQVKQMEASVREAEESLRRTVIKSPIDGIVVQKNKEVGEIALGSQFKEDVILVVADLSQMEARVEVNENDIIHVDVGDTAYIHIDAFPDSVFKGVVTEISNAAKTKAEGTVEEVTNFEVKIRLFKRLESFRPGMSTTADIATETHKNVLNVPIQSVTVREREVLQRKMNPEEKSIAERAAQEESAPRKKGPRQSEDLVEVVFVVENGVVHMRPVKLGISDDNYYEVLSGLKEGEEVVTGPYRVLSKVLKDGDRVKVVKKKRKTL